MFNNVRERFYKTGILNSLGNLHLVVKRKENTNCTKYKLSGWTTKIITNAQRF